MPDTPYDDDSATFGDRMALARERLGLSQAQLAQRLGVKPATIQGWEGDRAEPRANRLQMLAGLLNVPMVWLMSGEGVGAPASPEPRDQTLLALAAELRETRMAQARVAERLARIEKRLQALANRG